MITDQICQHGWAFFRILNLVAGLCPVGPCLVGSCWTSVGWHSSNFNLHIKKSPNCAAFSVACAPLSVHITPIVMSAPLNAVKARIPRKCMPLSQRNHLPQLLRISLNHYSCTPLLDHSTLVPTPAAHYSHSADARWKVTMHSLIQAHLPGTHCQPTSEMQQPPMRSSQRLDRNLQPRTFWITQFMFDLLSLSLCARACKGVSV